MVAGCRHALMQKSVNMWTGEMYGYGFYLQVRVVVVASYYNSQSTFIYYKSPASCYNYTVYVCVLCVCFRLSNFSYTVQWEHFFLFFCLCLHAMLECLISCYIHKHPFYIFWYYTLNCCYYCNLCIITEICACLCWCQVFIL